MACVANAVPAKVPGIHAGVYQPQIERIRVEQMTMNRAEKRRQRKLATKAARGSGRVQPPGQNGDALAAALHHHGAGRFAEAERCYREILAGNPEHPVALHLFGVLCGQAGNPDAAVELITKALSVKPDYAEAHYNLGIIRQGNGDPDSAAENFRKAIALKPDYAEAHNNLGNVLRERGELDAAAVSFHAALAVRPDFPDAHYNLGIVYQEWEDQEKAAVCFRKAISARPDFAEAHNNLGNALKAMDNPKSAIASYRAAIKINPRHAEAIYNLGSAFLKLDDPREAIRCFQDALALTPDDAEIHRDLGLALREIGERDQAIASFRRALEIKPDYTAACFNLCNALRDQGKVDEVAHTIERALEASPDDEEVHFSLGTAYVELGRLDEAVASYRAALAIKPDFAEARSNLLFTELYRPGHDKRSHFDLHREWEEHHGRPLRGFWPAHANDPDPDRRLKVGFVSSDLGRHPVGYFVVGLLENLPKAQFETHAYSGRKDDDMTARIKAATDVWCDARELSDEELAERVVADGIDILVDLAGHTGRNRMSVFARKPAPVQVEWAGYAATSGLDAIDYLVSDIHSTREDEEGFYSETIRRMPDSWLCYEAPDYAPDVGPPPFRENGFVTFASFNNPSKLNADVLDLWADVLARRPESRLLLKYRGMTSASNSERVRSLFAARGIAEHRLILEDSSPHRDLLAAYNRTDIALDPFPYSGGMTTLEALWMGVPVITLPGDTFASRHSLSFLTTLGLTELVGAERNDYVDIAAGLAGEPERLAELRQGLRERMASSPVCDAEAFAAAFAGLLRGMWLDWCRAEA